MDRRTEDLLRHTELFQRLDERELRNVARQVRERRIARDEVLFRQGEASDSLYVIASGRLRVSASDRAGHEKVLAFLGAGEIVGEMGLLGETTRSATVVAVTDALLLQLRKRDFDAFVATNVASMRDLGRAVARRRLTTQQRIQREARTDGGEQAGLVTTVFSPRGGAGTTTLATNLAVTLAQRAPDQVVLLDLNLLFGHTPVLLNLVPRTSLAAVSPISLRQMDRENLEFYLTRHTGSSLRVLTGALRPEQAELVAAEHVAAAIDVMRTHFLHVVIDLGRSFSETNLTAVERTQNLLLVCTPERIGVRGVTVAQRIFRDAVHVAGDPMLYVLNHLSPQPSLEAGQVESALSAPLLASIPFGGDAVGRAALEGHPLVMRWPNSPTSKAIGGIADRIQQQLAEVLALAPGHLASPTSRHLAEITAPASQVP
jgi:CRP-like cAMP-binding protein